MMSGWAIFWIIVAVLIVVGILMNLRDLIRYLKIRGM
jgi:phosphotransferase system  glucose/maltose/N-acetylglucosamine-specific IIC component